MPDLTRGRQRLCRSSPRLARGAGPARGLPAAGPPLPLHAGALLLRDGAPRGALVPGAAVPVRDALLRPAAAGIGSTLLRGELGLLAAEFETAEADKTNVWRWLTMDEAREAGTTGLPAACPGEGDDGAASPPEGARRSGGAPLPPPPQGASPAALAVAPPAAAARRRALGALGGCAGRLCG
ncbi:unnamed protein product [Prorocentrum cordatum]|uniref:Uncharacterized protein n=1 Tax=Prorocentrum cordatum TaxID=2364126 RepID=A0ABN9R3F5_9DINO|nr:unnamed protein product [Polarella glacialis]